MKWSIKLVNNDRTTLSLMWLTWILFYPVRALSLGFYHDDWKVFLDAPSIHNSIYLLQACANRPILGLYLSLVSWVTGGSIPLLHVMAALLVLVTAFSMRSFFKSMTAYAFGTTSSAGPTLAVCLWLVMPWTLGTTAWITTNPTLLSVIGFALAGRALIRYWRNEARLFPALPVGILLSSLTYEIFIPQIPILIGLYFLNPARGISAMRSLHQKLTQPVLIIILSLILVMGLRHLAELSSKTAVKAYSSAWLTIFGENLTINWFFEAFGRVRIIPWAIIVVLGLLAAMVMVEAWGKQSRVRRPVVIFLMLSAIGYTLSCLVPSFIGMKLVGTGVDSRITIGVSFWLSFMFCVLLTGALLNGRTMPSLFSASVTVFLYVCFAVSMAVQLAAWSSIWRQEYLLLSRIRTESLLDMQPGALVVLDGPVSQNGIYGFNSYWDFQSAMERLIPSRRDITYLVANDWWRVSREGAAVLQHHDATVLLIYSPPEVWILEKRTGQLRPMEQADVVGIGEHP